MGVVILMCAVVITTAFLVFTFAYDLWHFADAIERQNAMLEENENNAR